MGTLLIILLVLLLLGGGGGYYGYSRWGASGGIGIFGLVLIILLIAFGACLREGRPLRSMQEAALDYAPARALKLSGSRGVRPPRRTAHIARAFRGRLSRSLFGFQSTLAPG
jgi:hypothetical protein